MLPPSWMAFLPAGIALAALAILLIGIPEFVARLIETAAVFTLLISSFNLTFGYGGELTFNQLFLFAAGGMTAGYLSVHAQQPDLLIALPVVVLVSILIGLPIGLPGLRFGYLSSAMVSLFLIQLFPMAAQAVGPWTGGLFGIGLPTLAGLQLDKTSFYITVIALVAIWLAAMRNLTLSHWGDRLRVLRTSPILAQTLGLSPLRLKLAVYALSCVPAGIAGALFAYMNTLVLPINTTGALLLLGGSVIGGAVSVYGAIAGALAIELVPYLYLQYAGSYDVLLGMSLIVVSLVLPGGAAEVGRRLWARTLVPNEPVSKRPVFVRGIRPGAEVVMSGVRRSFGGVRALDDVDFRAIPGEITALVGPNGSGKTTLLNVISGAVAAEAGSVMVAGREIAGLSPHQIAQHGIRRTFQTPMLPAGSILSAVMAGRLGGPHPGLLATMGRLPSFGRSFTEDRRAAVGALDRVGVNVPFTASVGEIPVATRRLVELARCIAAEPSVVLLDEPASGLDDAELRTLAAVLEEMSDAGTTVVLVEHNLEFVQSVADTLYVMREGRAIATGRPADVFRRTDAQAAFLGG